MDSSVLRRRLTWPRVAVAEAALLVAALVAAALLTKPLVTARLRSVLEHRVGDVQSLQVSGSRLQLLTGRPQAIQVTLGAAHLGAGTADSGRLRSLPRLDLQAETLDTGRLTLQDAKVTKRGDHLEVTGTVPTQPMGLAGRELTVVPSAVDGGLRLAVEGIPVLSEVAVMAVDGRVQVIATDGPWAGRPLPRLGGSAPSQHRRRIDHMAASTAEGKVHLSVSVTQEA